MKLPDKLALVLTSISTALSTLRPVWREKREASSRENAELRSYFVDNPGSVTFNESLTYKQALECIRAEPAYYSRMMDRLYALDAKNEYQLFRIAVESDSEYLRYAKDQENIPVDLLEKGMDSILVWAAILAGWKPYTQEAFKAAYSTEYEFVELMKLMGHHPQESRDLYRAWKAEKLHPATHVDCLLPDALSGG